MLKITVGIAAVGFLVAVAIASREASAGESNPANQVCVKMFQRQRACTETFIPALVDLRIELDKPAGIQTQAKTEGRSALISVANEEWRQDSTDEAIIKTCGAMAGSQRQASMASASQPCLAASTCEAFTACAIPLMRQNLK